MKDSKDNSSYMELSGCEAKSASEVLSTFKYLVESNSELRGYLI